MEINRYLKDLGLTWYDLPGNYISKASIKIRLKNRYAIDRSQAVIILLEGKFNKELDYCVSYALENRKTVYYIDLREGINKLK